MHEWSMHWQARAVPHHIRLCHVRCTICCLGGTLVRRRWVDETFDVHANCHKSVACVGNMRHRRCTPRCADVLPNIARQALHWTPSAFQVFGRHETFFPRVFFHSSVMSETKAPSAEELAAVKLKNAQTKEGGAFDEAPYKAVWESSGGDGAKAAETIGLQGVPASYDEYIALVKSGKFKD